MGLKNKLMSISMAGLTAGATLLGGEKTDAEKKPEPEQTVTQKTQTARPTDMLQETIDLQALARQYNAQYYIYKGKSYRVSYGYDASFLFALSYSVLKDKPSFEFDGVTYQTETAMQENAALRQARQKGLATYSFNGKEKPAISQFPGSEQMAVFGNMYEELISPQSKETKKNLERFAKDCSKNSKDALELLNRMYTLSRLSGYPEILEQTDDNMNLMSKVIEKGCQHKTPHYEPSLFGRSTIWLVPGCFSDLIPEMAHAFRDHNNVFGEAHQFVGDALKDILTFNSLGFGADAQIKNYKNPQRMEHDAHSVVQPALMDYASGKIETIDEMYFAIDSARKRLNNEYTWTSEAKKNVENGRKLALQKSDENGVNVAHLAKVNQGQKS